MNWGLFQNSLLVALAAAYLATFLGTGMAVFVASFSTRVRQVFTICGIVALALPPFLVTNTWMHYFGLTGVWRPWIDFDIYSLKGTILLITLLTWPVSFLLVLARVTQLQSIYLEQEPALRKIAFIRYLFWPFVRPALIQSFCLTFVLALNNFAVPTLLQTKVYAEELWLSFTTNFDYAAALKLSWPMIVAPLLLLSWIHTKSIRWQFRTENFSHKLYRERLGAPIRAGSGLVTALTLGVSLVLPLLQLLSSGRTWQEFWPAMAAGKMAAWNSVLFAGCSALLVIILGTLARNRPWPILFWVSYLMPGMLLGIAFIWALNRPGTIALYQSVGIVLLAFGLRYFALGWSSARWAGGACDPEMAQVVKIFGGNRRQEFLLAQLPQMKGTLLAGLYIVFLFCLWEVETLILIVPPGKETLSLRIFNMLHYGHAGQVDALCVWLLLIAVAPLLLAWLVKTIHGIRRPLAASIPLFLLFAGCGQSEKKSTRVKGEIFSSVQVIGSRGTGAGQFNKPRSLAVDRDDNLYVVDLTGRVQKFSLEGQFLQLWQMPQTDKGKPKGMIQDRDGNIILIEPHYSRVNHFDPSGRLLTQWGEPGTNWGRLMFPRAAAVNSRGDIYVSEYGMRERIQCFTHKGTKFLVSFGSQGVHPGEINRAEGIGIGPDESLFVADSCNHRVQVFSPEGKLLTAFGKAGSGAGELSYPYDVRVDTLGNRFVCEFGNSRIQVFDSMNRAIEIVGRAGAEPGEMNNPWAIALDSQGNVLVADSGNHRVQKFIRKKPLPRVSPKSTSSPVSDGKSIALK